MLRSLGIAVDVVVFTVVDGRLEVLLTRRPAEHEVFPGAWALPGGVIAPDESAEDAAARALEEKAGVRGVFLEQLYTFSDPSRDPRGRVVSIAYYALTSPDRLEAKNGAKDRFEVGQTPPLAFDHQAILDTAVERIRGKLEYTPIGFQLLGPRFTLTELQQVYEAVLGHDVDKRNFRNKVLKSQMVRATDEKRTGPHRPAVLYEFTDRTF